MELINAILPWYPPVAGTVIATPAGRSIEPTQNHARPFATATASIRVTPAPQSGAHSM